MAATLEPATTIDIEVKDYLAESKHARYRRRKQQSKGFTSCQQCGKPLLSGGKVRGTDDRAKAICKACKQERTQSDKHARKASRQRFANERLTRELNYKAGWVTMPDYTREDLFIIHHGTIVDPPNNELRLDAGLESKHWHWNPVFQEPINPSCPSVCGYWDGETHPPHFALPTENETSHWEKILAMPAELYWPKGQTMQLSVMHTIEDANEDHVYASMVEEGALDDGEVNTAVVESLHLDEENNVIEAAPVEEEEATDEPESTDEETTEEPERFYELTPSWHTQHSLELQVKLRGWWLNRHPEKITIEPFNYDYAAPKCKSEANRYKWIWLGGSRLEFSHRGRCCKPGTFSPIGTPCRPLHDDGRWCPCLECVRSRASRACPFKPANATKAKGMPLLLPEWVELYLLWLEAGLVHKGGYRFSCGWMHAENDKAKPKQPDRPSAF